MSLLVRKVGVFFVRLILTRFLFLLRSRILEVFLSVMCVIVTVLLVVEFKVKLLTVVGMLSRSDASWAGRAVEVRTGLLESMVSISEISEGFSPPCATTTLALKN